MGWSSKMNVGKMEPRSISNVFEVGTVVPRVVRQIIADEDV